MSLTSTAAVPTSHQSVSRPLTVLIPLIKEALTEGDSAGMAHYRQAGAMLLEAKAQVPHGGWTDWLTQNFHLSMYTAQVYMKIARKEKPSGLGFSSLREMIEPDRPPMRRIQPWTEPVKQAMDDQELIERIRRDTQSKVKESRLVRELGLKLIDIGYKVLSTKVHPDTGGNHDAMRRLNHVRDLLKKAL